MKIIVAQSSAAVADSEGHVAALLDALAAKGHATQRLHLPPLATPERALANAVSFRLLATQTADALICLDPAAALLRHSRKLAWLLADCDLGADPGHGQDEPAFDRRYRANLLRTALGEARALFAPSQFALDRLHALGLGKARLLRPSLPATAAPYARNPGPELLLLNPLDERQRPDLLVDCLAALPAPYRARWVAASAQPDALARLRRLAASAGVEQRLAVDLRAIDGGETAYLLAHAAALLDLAEGQYARADTVSQALAQGVPVIACSDGGALAEGGPTPARPTGAALARAVLAARAAPAKKAAAPARASKSAATGWAALHKALSA